MAVYLQPKVRERGFRLRLWAACQFCLWRRARCCCSMRHV